MSVFFKYNDNMLRQEVVAILVGAVQKICFLTGRAVRHSGSVSGVLRHDLSFVYHYRSMFIYTSRKALLSAARCAFLVLALASLSESLAFTAQYSHYSEDEDLVAVLSDFARAQGLHARISPVIQGKLSGRFDAVSPDVFMDTLKRAFGVKYYIQGDIINFYHDSEWVRSMYKPSAVSAASMLGFLKDARAVVDALPVTVDSHGMLVMQGPESYIQNIMSLAQSFDRRQEQELSMHVFRLRHARVNDTSISTSSKNVVVPGVATLLSRMVAGGFGSGASSLGVSRKSQMLTGLRGTGLSATAAPKPAADAGASAGDSSGGPAEERGFTPSIIADERLNAILVYDYKSRIPFYQEVINELDVPVRMVELHAAIVDIDVDASEELGIDWHGSAATGNWSIDGGKGAYTDATGKYKGGVFSTVFNTAQSNFMIQVKALESDGRAKTLGRPSVLTMENTEATLENTTTNYVPVSGNDSSDLFSVTAGTVLQVIPHIVESNDGTEPIIQMIITLKTNQDSNGNDIANVGTSAYIPSVKETVVNTQAMVRHGQSLLIGGYYVESLSDTDDGVPILKDIPLLGRLFSTEGRKLQKRERILLITPRIVTLDDLSRLPDKASGFGKDPGQTDYLDREERLKVPARPKDSSGCASSRSLSADQNRPAAPETADGVL